MHIKIESIYAHHNNRRPDRTVGYRAVYVFFSCLYVCVYLFFFFLRIGGLIIFLLVSILLHTKTHVQKTTPNGGVGGVG